MKPLLISTMIAICTAAFGCLGTADASSFFVIAANRTPTGDQYHIVSSAAFAPADQNMAYTRTRDFSNTNHTRGWLQLQAPSQPVSAPVTLPHRSTVSQMTIYVERGSGRCEMALVKDNLANADPAAVVVSTSTDSLVGGQYGGIDIAIADEVLDNGAYQYILSWYCSGFVANDKLYAVRFTYTLP